MRYPDLRVQPEKEEPPGSWSPEVSALGPSEPGSSTGLRPPGPLRWGWLHPPSFLVLPGASGWSLRTFTSSFNPWPLETPPLPLPHAHSPASGKAAEP